MGMRQEQDVAPARKELASLNWQMDDLKKSYVADAEGRWQMDDLKKSYVADAEGRSSDKRWKMEVHHPQEEVVNILWIVNK